MRRYHYVKELSALSKNEAVIKHLSTAIASVAIKLDDKNKPSPMTVYRWWQRWESCNQELMALAQKPRKNTIHRRFKGIVGEEIHKAIEEVYLTAENNTEQAAYDALCHQINILNAARTQPLAKPSRATFYRICARYDNYSVMAARKGKAAADRYFRSTGIGVVPQFILERAEIDHTPLDLIIVDDVTGLPLGRPLATFLIDRYSRMPLGFEIGFNEASLLSVMAALRHAIMPKSYLKETYPDIENEWPAHGIPSTLVCDNGLEFHAMELRRMCAELNIEIIFCPKKQPHYKGAIERFQGTFNRQISQRIPGTTFSSIEQRGDYNAVENARVTLTEIKKLIHHWIVDIYNQSKNRMSRKSPSALWGEGLALVEPRLPESADLLRLVMAKQETKALTHAGIQYKGLMYNSSEIAALRIKNNGNAEVKIRVNPVDISSIWVHDDHAGDYIRVPCLYQEYAKGLSLYQHETIRKSERLKTKTLINEEGLLREKSKLDCLIRDMSHDKK
jgi:putative transposase